MEDEKILFVEMNYGGYYEPSISLDMLRPNCDGYEAEMFKIENKKDFVTMLDFLYSDNEFGNAMEELSVKQFANIKRCVGQLYGDEFENRVIPNLKTLLRIVRNSYSYSLNGKLNMALFGSHSDYGSFGQQVLPFNDWLLLLKTEKEFKKYVTDKLPTKLKKLVYVGDEEARIVELESSINWFDESIDRYKKEIKKDRKDKNRLVKELNKLKLESSTDKR